MAGASPKDRHPFPVPLRVYDETLRVLKDAVEKARLGNDERLEALQRLDTQARLLERTSGGPTFHEYLDREERQSASLGGMSVFGPATPVESPASVEDAAPAPVEVEKVAAR